MTLDEQELRQRLAATATLASPPGFAAESLTRRIRRRRARITAAVSAASLVLAAVAVAVPIGLTSGGPTSNPSPPLPFDLSLTMTVNGHSRDETWPHDASKPMPRFVITPPEHLAITVIVTIPAHATVRTLWLGIATDRWGFSSGHKPIGMHPVLAHTRQPFTGGSHTFTMTWNAPAGLRHGLFMTVAWTARATAVTGAIAELDVRVGDHIYRPPGATTRPAPTPTHASGQ